MKKGIAFLGLLFLAACSHGAPPACPQTGYVKHATFAKLADGGEARIQGFGGDCRIAKDGKSAELNLVISFATDKPDKKADVPFFVAALGPDERILSRQSLTANAPGDEEVTVRLPIADAASAPGYKVLMGFALTHEQFAYNKEHGK